MSFEDVMREFLPVFTKDGITYVPYINKSGEIPAIDDPIRSDYDDPRDSNIHGGVDIIYCKLRADGTKEYIGSDNYPNNDLPSVYAPVSGEIIAISPSNGDGGVSILDENGYVHTIYHMSGIPEAIKVGARVSQGSTEIGKMDGKGDGNNDAHPNHVHYEINTYYEAGVDRYRKIDPEAFWNNEEAFELTGSFKKGNIFYGTSNNEILKGEGVRDLGNAIDNSDNDTLLGGGGSDIIDGGTGDDNLFGGNSYGENLYYSIEDGELDKTEEEDADESADTLIGGMGEDKLYGGKGDDVLYGGVATIANGEVNYDPSRDEDDSDDKLYGEEGDDILWGGTGQDHMEGGPGNDTFKIIGTDEAYDEFYGGEDEDKIEGSDENDTIRVNKFEGEATVEIIDGGDGDEDKIAGTNLADIIDLSETTLIDIEKIETGDQNDVIKLGEELGNLEKIDGGPGDKDTIIYNDNANDIFIGVERGPEQSDSDITLTGIEKIDGAGGDDKFYWSNNTQVKSIDGGGDTNEVIGSDSSAPADWDYIDLSKVEAKNIQIIRGRGGNDVIIANDEDNEIYGGTDKDSTDEESDLLVGKGGYDQYFAGPSDIINDSDHRGSVHFEDTRLTGGKKEEGKYYWEGNGGKYFYLKEIKTLIFEIDGKSITILNYDKDQHSLGIYLEEDDKESQQKFSSPLVLDLNNNNTLSVTEYDSPAYFDLDGDGFKEKTGWIEAEDGLLSLDKNANGTIDNGNELFGSYTKDKNGNYFDNGFAALSSYDINKDGIINANDDVYSSLKVWIDANQDGISQTDELHTLDSLHINSINLNAQEISDNEGLNLITHEATFVQQQVDGQGNVLTGEQGDPLTELKAVKDVWFYRRSADTAYDFNQEIPPEVLALPDMKGAGRVKNLAHAMTEDSILINRVNSLLSNSNASLQTLQNNANALLARWTHTEDIDLTETRGEQLILNHNYDDPEVKRTYRVYAMARDVAIIEAFDGSEFQMEVGGEITTDVIGTAMAHEMDVK